MLRRRPAVGAGANRYHVAERRFPSGTSALKRVELYDFSDAGTSTLLEFDVANAHCFSPVDETKLRSIIESGGASNFNDMIREGACEESAVCFWFS